MDFPSRRKPTYEQRKSLESRQCQKSSTEQLLPVAVDSLSRFIKRQKTKDLLLKKGVKNFFPVQYETYSSVYGKHDMIARDRTGSGKTLAYSLPIIQRFRDKAQFQDHSTKFLIVLPTRELANQVNNEIKSLRYNTDEFNVIAVYGGTPIGEQISQIQIGADIIVSTPGRLLDFLERGVIKLGKLEVVCLDEADEMLRQGFQEDIEKIFRFIKKQQNCKTQNLLFSATIPGWVVELSRTYLSQDRKFIDLIKDSAVKTSKTIEHFSINLNPHQRDSALAKVVDYYSGKDGRTIIFTQTKRQADSIGSRACLKQSHQVLHGDIPQRKRQFVYKNFKQGVIQCIIATNVAARGLDIPEVDLVVQLQPPKDVQSYIHRAGRTGRAGKSGVCIIFFSDSQRRLIDRIEEVAQIKFKQVEVPRDNQKPFIKKVEQKPGNSQKQQKTEKRQSCLTPQTNNSETEQATSPDCYIHCTLRLRSDFISMAPVFDFMQTFFSPKTYEQVINMKRSGSNSASFEIPSKKRDEILKIAKSVQELPEPKYELFIVDESTKKPTPTFHQSKKSVLEPANEINVRQAQRRRKQLQVCIGGLSYSMTEDDLESYLHEKKVKTVKVRLLMNEQGDSKGMAFVLCADDKNVKEALKLNGTSLRNKIIRVNQQN